MSHQSEQIHEDNFVRQFLDWEYWIHFADKNLESAKLLGDELNNLRREKPSSIRNFKIGSYRGSILLLVGLALENVIKGYIIYRAKTDESSIKEDIFNQDYKRIEVHLKKNYCWKFNHQITEMFQKNLIETYNTYSNFLSRVQENLIWMGKYGLPNQSFAKNMKQKRDYSSEDLNNATKIIDHIKELTKYYYPNAPIRTNTRR